MTDFGRRGATRAGIVGTVLVLIVAAACIRLGFWQLERLAQRRALNAVTAERMGAAPTAIDLVPADTAGAVWRRARMEGGCEGAQIVLAGRSRHGTPGVHLLCRFRTAGGRVVLLDRGWLPSADARTVGTQMYEQAPRDTVLEALIVPFPRGEASARAGTSPRLAQSDEGLVLAAPEPRVVYRLNRAEASAAAGVQLPGWYAQAIGPPGRFPIPPDPPDPGDGPHLGYAIQWFSFAAIALIGWLVLFLRRRERVAGPVRPPAPHAGTRDEANP